MFYEEKHVPSSTATTAASQAAAADTNALAIQVLDGNGDDDDGQWWKWSCKEFYSRGENGGIDMNIFVYKMGF